MISHHDDKRDQARPNISSNPSCGKISRAQLSAVGLVALLSPLLRVLPHNAVELAGKAAWLSVIPAAVVLVGLALFMNVLRRQILPGEGLADLFLRWLGPIAGRIFLVAYALWLLLYAGFTLRSGAERLVTSIYPNCSLDPFTIVMILLCLFAALGALRTTARLSVIMRAVLLFVLAFVFLFSVPDVSMANLLPIRRQDAGGILLGSWSYFTVGAVAVYFSFLNSYVEPVERPGKWLALPMILFLIVACLLCLEVVGVFGPALTLEWSHPFFAMVRDISILDITQRVDALVLTLCVFADFILCTFLLRCAHETIRRVFSLPSPEGVPMLSFRRGRWLIWVEAGLILLFNYLIPSSAVQLSYWSNHVIPIAAACSIYIVLPLIWCIGKMRGKMLPTQKK